MGNQEGIKKFRLEDDDGSSGAGSNRDNRRTRREIKRNGGPELLLPADPAAEELLLPGPETAMAAAFAKNGVHPSEPESRPRAAAKVPEKKPRIEKSKEHGRRHPKFDPEAISKSAEEAYVALEKGVRELHLTPDKLPEDIWDDAHRALVEIKALGEGYENATLDEKWAKSTKAKTLLTRLQTGSIRRDIAKKLNKPIPDIAPEPSAAKKEVFSKKEQGEIVLDVLNQIAPIKESAPTPPYAGRHVMAEDIQQMSAGARKAGIETGAPQVPEKPISPEEAKRIKQAVVKGELDLDLSEAAGKNKVDIDVSKPIHEEPILVKKEEPVPVPPPEAEAKENRNGDDEEIIEDALETIDEKPPEGTRKEFKDMLKGLVSMAEGRANESRDKVKMFEVIQRSRAYLSDRIGKLDAKANGIGLEGKFRSWGESYNKLGWKSKLAIGASLGVGAAFSLSFSAPLALTAACTGIVVQRTVALASMYLRFEKNTQENKWGKEMAMAKAMLYTAGMTAGTMLAVKELAQGIDVARNTEWGKATQEWLGSVLGHHSAATVAPVHHDAMPAPHAEVPAALGIKVEATPGHGYEHMMKRLWEQLHEKHVALPKNVSHESDLAKLLAANHTSIDKIVHQIAANPKHAFYHADGTSVRIDAGSHMAINPDGQIHLTGPHTDVVHAPEHAPVTPPYHPHVPTTALVHEAAPPPPAHEPPPAKPPFPAPAPAPHPAEAVAAPVIERHTEGSRTTSSFIFSDDAVKNSKFTFIDNGDGHKLVSYSAEPAGLPNTLTDSERAAELNRHALHYLESHNQGASPEATALQHEIESLTKPKVELPKESVPATQPPAPVIEHGFTVNKFNVTVPIAEPHLYAEANGAHLFVFGGSPTEQSKMIAEYLTKNPGEIVYGTDEHHVFRIPWQLVDGKVLPGAPVQEETFFGMLKSFMKAPSPDEFEKIIK